MNTENKIIDSMSLDEEERIIAYLKGKMSVDEESIFIKELNENPELRSKAISIARLIKGMKKIGKVQDQSIKEALLSSTNDDIQNIVRKTISSKKQTNVVSMRKVSAWFSIAASVIFIIWVGIGYNDYKKTTGLAEEYGNLFEVSMITRGQDKTQKELECLFNNVKTKTDLKSTLHQLSLYWELSIMDTYNDYTDYSAEIGWNLAIGYLKDNNKEEAGNILKRMLNIISDNLAVKDLIIELLDELELKNEK